MIPFCPGIILEAAVDRSFNSTEKKLLCGEASSGDPAWRHIPSSQARFFFRNFLQARGYHQPQFREVQDVLYVNAGDQSIVTAVRPNWEPSTTSPIALELDRNRKLIGEVLTPAFLDRTERWTYGRLQNLGYPCPSVSTQADPATGSVLLNLNPGPLLPLKRIEEDDALPELLPGTFRRYDAFTLGKPFQGDLMALTERRVITSEVVHTIHFTVDHCDPDGAVVKQELIPGLPRLLSFGFGANTEGILLSRASWKNSRFGDQASSFEVQMLASFLRQDISAEARWYYLPFPSRIHLRPSVTLYHQAEEFFEIFSASTRLDQARSWDFLTSWTSMGLATSVRAGPKLEFLQFTDTIRGTDPKNSAYLSLEGLFSANSHSFEFHQLSPKSGFQTNFEIEKNQKGVLAPVTADRLSLSGEGLWNLHNYEPPLLIFGIRGSIRTTLTEEVAPFDQLPPTYRHYLGGSTDLRGFGRLELPADGEGSLSTFFLDWEIRTGPILPLGIAPFFFLDTGLLGNRPFAFDRNLYWSPGVGARWESPVGVIRASIAHGYVTELAPDSKLSHWQLYLSFGEEF